MQKFSVDFEKLDNKLLKRVYRLSDVSDRIEKVAFDIVRFKDGDEASKLWQVQSADDGEYIVCLYQDGNIEKQASKPDWEVTFTKASNSVNIYYKGDPIVKIAAHNLGLPVSDIAFINRYLPKKLSENIKLVKALLNTLSEPAKNSVLNKYPELA